MDLTTDDLMRGDYVIARFSSKNDDDTEWAEDRIAMIVGIGEYNCVDIVIREDDGSWSRPTDIRVNCLAPIPIEKAFLVLNGFSEDDMYARMNTDISHIHLEYYYFEKRLRRIYTGTDEWDNHSKVYDVIFQCHCTYVHEFQHGMKLAGERQKIKI